MGKKINFRQARNILNPRLRFYNDHFVFDTVSGAFYRLSPIAGSILKGFAQGEDENKLVERIQKKYGIDRSTVLRDIELFINSLLAAGLKEEVLSKQR